VTHASTTAGALLPPQQEDPQTRALKTCALDKPHSISAVPPTEVVKRNESDAAAQTVADSIVPKDAPRRIDTPATGICRF
jgi:hypothetical protein